MSTNASIRRLTSAAVLAGMLTLLAIAAHVSTNFDFRAFYCAGSAVRAQANPYHTEPLHTCEWRKTDVRLAAFAREIVVPAPQPGYDLAAFALLSMLPFGAAAKIWTALLCVCAAGTAVVVARLSKSPLALTAVAFWLSLGVTSISLGEIVPVCALAATLAAFFAQRGKWSAAGTCCAASLVEPHIGIPVCLAMFIWAPRARVALCSCVALLAAVSFAALGAAENVEYVASVLPTHAASEIASDAQLSAAVILHWLGASDGVALRLGTLSYAAMTLIAVVLCRRLALGFADDAFLVVVPAAFAVIGGVFIHVTEAALALPLVFLCLRYVAPRARARSLLQAALVLLSVPWWSLATPMLLTPSASFAMLALVVTYAVWRLSNGNFVAAVTWGALSLLAVAGLIHWHAATSVAFTNIGPPRGLLAARYPEASWAWFSAKYMSTGSPATWLLRALTWTGLTGAGLWATFIALQRDARRCDEARVAQTTGAL